MGRILSIAAKTFREMDRFSVAVLRCGLQLTCGLYAMAILFLLLPGTGLASDGARAFQALVLYHAAADTAPAVLVAALAAAFLCDIAVKDRAAGGRR